MSDNSAAPQQPSDDEVTQFASITYSTGWVDSEVSGPGAVQREEAGAAGSDDQGAADPAATRRENVGAAGPDNQRAADPAATRREGQAAGGPGVTRREHQGSAAAGATRREDQASATPGATQREGHVAGGAGATQRDGATSTGATWRAWNLPPAVEANYEYIRDLDKAGGEAVIAVVRERATGTERIFKMYVHGYGPDPIAMAQLKAAKDSAEHIVVLHDYGEMDQGTWEIQEFCPLGSLVDLIERRGGRLRQGQLEEVVRETASALSHLHGLGQGMAHHDVKPGNVLVRSEEPLDLVLADFGLTRADHGLTHVTKTVKGSFHYAAPEVSGGISTAKSDWFALGAMVYEFYVGRKLFSADDGTEISDMEARARCQQHAYSTALVDSKRWRLLCDGLLTWDKDHRWGADQVNAWLSGGSPEVYRGPARDQATPARGSSYRPNWSPKLVSSPPELAEQFRQHWDEAANELVGRPDAKMVAFLEAFPGMEQAVRVLKSNEAPGPKLVRLQAILDPDNAVCFEGTRLDDASLQQRIQAAAAGNELALDWLTAVLDEHILTAYAEVKGSQVMAEADFLLALWKEQADSATRPLPANYQAIARQAFRVALPELFVTALSPAAAQ